MLVHSDNDLYSSPVVFIPFNSTASDSEKFKEEIPCSSISSEVASGPGIRLAVYDETWLEFFDVAYQGIISFYRPLGQKIMEFVVRAYEETTDLMLPYPELPVAVISGDDNSTSFVLYQITNHLTAEINASQILVVQLAHKDCSSLILALRAIVSGFVQQAKEPLKKRTGISSLANYDLSMLEAWYDHEHGRDFGDERHTKLVVILQGIEAFDPTILQDLFHLCSTRVPRLPFVFLMATSVTDNILRQILPLSSRTSLDVCTFPVPGGMNMFDSVLHKVFLDANFEYPIRLGPKGFRQLKESFTSQMHSLDALLSTLQLILMDHCMQPFSVFIRSDTMGSSQKSALKWLSSPSSSTFKRNLHAKAHPHSTSPIKGNTDTELLKHISYARTIMAMRAKSFRVAFGILRHIIPWVSRQGTKPLVAATYRLSELFEMTLDDSSLGTIVKDMVTRIRQYEPPLLAKFVSEIQKYISTTSNEADETEPLNSEAGKWLASLSALSKLPTATSVPKLGTTVIKGPATELWAGPGLLKSDVAGVSKSSESGKAAEGIAKWIGGYLTTNLSNIEDVPLHEIWYLNPSGDCIMGLNPSPHTTIVQALMKPDTYIPSTNPPPRGPSIPAPLNKKRPKTMGNAEDNILSGLPDTAALLHRYMDSGRVINTYDWYEAFAVAMHGESRPAQVDEDGDEGTEGVRRKGKKRGKDEERDDGGEKWKKEVQARFLMCVHELEWMGFLKTTGRKKDHLLRTVFDIRN